MKQFAKITLIFSLIITGLGLVLGFGAMFLFPDSPAVNLLVLAPIGFLLLFASMTVWVLLGGD